MQALEHQQGPAAAAVVVEFTNLFGRTSRCDVPADMTLEQFKQRYCSGGKDSVVVRSTGGKLDPARGLVAQQLHQSQPRSESQESASIPARLHELPRTRSFYDSGNAGGRGQNGTTQHQAWPQPQPEEREGEKEEALGVGARATGGIGGGGGFYYLGFDRVLRDQNTDYVLLLLRRQLRCGNLLLLLSRVLPRDVVAQDLLPFCGESHSKATRYVPALGGFAPLDYTKHQECFLSTDEDEDPEEEAAAECSSA